MATASAGVRREGKGALPSPLCEIERATDECRPFSGRPWMQGQQPRGPAVREGTRGGGRLRRHSATSQPAPGHRPLAVCLSS